MNWRKEIVDQSAHIFAAAAILSGVILYPHWWAFMIAGLAMGYSRERREGYNVFSRGGIRDMTGWTLGGLLGWCTVRGVIS